jgi:hypothetical protein
MSRLLKKRKQVSEKKPEPYTRTYQTMHAIVPAKAGSREDAGSGPA